jgi:hypothetical protein
MSMEIEGMDAVIDFQPFVPATSRASAPVDDDD